MPVAYPTSRIYHGEHPLAAMYEGDRKVWEPEWTPDRAAGLAVWWDAADVGTITTQWPDKRTGDE